MSLAGGKGVYGGFDEDFSVHDPDVFESIIQRKGCTGSPPGTVNALCTAGGFEATFSSFIVEGPVCTGEGQSSYGLYARGCGSALELSRNTFLGGQGGPGVTGDVGDKGEDGHAGPGGGGGGGPSVGLYVYGAGGLIPPGWGESDNDFVLNGTGGHGGSGGSLSVPDGPEVTPGKDGPHLKVNY